MEPENTNSSSFTQRRGLNTLSSILFYFSILFFIIGFNLSDHMAGNWYQQFMPNLGGRQITDITFLDSLTGYAVATQMSDTSYILKTTNGGDNWQIIYRSFFAMTHVQFLNTSTGFAGGGYLYKTINGGFNWSQLNTPASTVEKMFVLNQDTIWFVNSDGLVGGAFLTMNGGINWQQRFYAMNNNPSKIYFYNSRLGFISTNSNTVLRRTSDGGATWNIISGENGFNDIKFADSLTGWKAYGPVKKTIDGGLTWVQQTMPSGGIFSFTGAGKLSVLNRDTVWAVGGNVEYPNLQNRGVVYRTINGGQNWLFQIPDTSIHISIYNYIQFINPYKGWAYSLLTGIHTVTGGDPVWVTPIKQISSNIPKEFKLYQNYPNPFNPISNIKYQISNNMKHQTSNVKLIIYNIQGKEIITLVNEKQSAGTYEVEFSGKEYSSGIYLYTLFIDNVIIDTKKMVLIK